MDPSRLSLGEKIAGASALVLLLAMFILGWFSLDGITAQGSGLEGLGGEISFEADDLGALAEGSGEDTSANAWQSFSLIDLVLLAAILATAAVVGARLAGNSLPGEAGLAVLALGALSTLLLLFRIISPPDLIPGEVPDGLDFETDVGRGIGVFVGLIASAGIAYGGMLLRDGRSTPDGPASTAAPPPAATPPAAGGPPASPPPSQQN
jgi:hypothetical protein